MSGIVGIYYLDGRPVDRENLTKMVDILAHRGPDGADTWVDGCVGLGHRMLWTTPESLIEKLPYCNQRGDLVITADARIDNREELIAALQINNRPADKIADSELILAAYEKWGEDCPKHLLGDFAFAIWDERRQVLFCARDHMGVKPFYYYSSNDTFVFGSEIKAIFCLPNIPRKVNETRVAEYLLVIFEDKATTFYQNILRLPPGHCMTISKEDIKISCYWELNPHKELKLDSDEEYAQAFREIFTEAVRCRLRSAFPVGSTLSGGLDSSSITCVARNLLDSDKPLHTFSIIFEEISECDERPFINEVLAQGNFIPHYVCGDKISPLGNVHQMYKHHDEPFHFPNACFFWGISPEVKNQGVRVLLDGFDGDTTVSHGIGYLNELANTGEWLELIREVIGQAKYSEQSFWNLLSPYLWNHAVKPSHRSFIERVRRKVAKLKQPNTNNQTLLKREFVERIALREHLQAIYQMKPLLETQRDNHHRIITWGVVPFILEIIDRTAAAFSIEINHPFFDKRLIEFCLALPPQQKIHRGLTRIVLRRAMDNILPQKVQWRTDKNNFEPSVINGLLTLDKELVEQVICHNSEHIEDYVNIAPMRLIYQQLISNRTSQELFPVWLATTLSYWHSQSKLP